MSNQIVPRDLNGKVAEILLNRKHHLGVSYRSLETDTGINYMRIKRALDNERAITLDDFEDICTALGLTSWEVIRRAKIESQSA